MNRVRALVTLVTLALLVTACSAPNATSDGPSTSQGSTGRHDLPAPRPSSSSTAPATHATTQEAGAPESTETPAPVLDLEVEPLAADPVWDGAAQTSAIARATGFVMAWARPDLSADAWLKGVGGYLSPAAAELFAWTDPALIPASTVTGDAHVNDGASGTSARVTVPTDAGDMAVELIRSSSQTTWLVASILPAGETR